MLARGQPMLRSWLEAQPIVVIWVVVFVIAYLFTAVVFVLIAYSPASYRRHYKQLSPVTVTALSLVLGVLLGFLASRVWANFDRATGLVRQEASALAFSDPSLIGAFASATRRASPRLTTGEVLFTPELVAGR